MASAARLFATAFGDGDRLAALGHDDGEHLGGLGRAGVGGDGVQLTRRLVEGLALGQDCFVALVELELVAAFQHVAENVMAGMAVRQPSRRRAGCRA